MNANAKLSPSTPRPRRHVKEERINVRLEQALAERLRLAADISAISPSDKVRRILDAALPQTP